MKLPLILAIAIAAASMATRAQAQNYPWCAYYGDGNEAINCGFTTYEQCMADVSGIGGFCQQNNTYVPPSAAPRQHHSRKTS